MLPTAVPVSVLPSAVVPSPLPSITSPPASTATLPPSPTIPEPTPTETAVIFADSDLSISADDIFIHPVPTIFGGDLVTFHLLPHVPEIISPSSVMVEVQIEDELLYRGSLNGFNMAAEPYAIFEWIWQTEPEGGDYLVTVTVDPDDRIGVGDENLDNNQVVLTVPVRPASLRPLAEVGASWVTVENNCCRLHVVSNTPAYRDRESLKTLMDAAVKQAEDRMGETLQSTLDVYFIDRVLGQGGYATSKMVVSYLDRNYAGGGLYEVLIHETVHLLDQQFVSIRIPFLAEGMAVWVTGGHYKQEDLDQRARALRDTELYLPLAELINNFYAHQHEVGYLQAGAFLHYLVQTYGWEQVRAFYETMPASGTATLAELLDTQLQSHFGRSLAQVEADWLAHLDALPADEVVNADLLTTVRYYDLMRHYQLEFDPTAHFLQAWLPFPDEVHRQQLVADFNRHPEEKINVALEVMLHAVDRALMNGEYDQANVILDSVDRVLSSGGQFVDPVSASYYRIVDNLISRGYEVHQVDMNGNRATVQVTQGLWLHLTPLSLLYRNQLWVVAN